MNNDELIENKFTTSIAHGKSKRQVLVASEYQQLEVPIRDLLINDRLNLYPEIIGTKYFSIFLKQDKLIFQAGGYIGLIPINDRITLDIRPRVSISNIERILFVTNESPKALDFHLRDYARHDDASPSLIDILARSLTSSISEIHRYGLYKEYQKKEENTSFPKGRIMMGDTMRRHEARGIKSTVASTWFEHSTDSAPNRCIKYAIWTLLQRYRILTPREGQKKIVTELNHAYTLFGRVRLDLNKSFLNDPLIISPNKIDALRSYYTPIIKLALSVIENRGVSFSKKGADLVLASMIFDFDVVFENYLRKILKDKLPLFLSNHDVLDGNTGGILGGKKELFDEAPRREPATPDIVIKQQNAEDPIKKFPLIIEVKYKPVDYPARSDIDQAIGYSASYRCPVVVLAHPKRDNGFSGLRLVGKIDKFNLYQYLFDLSNPNPEAEENMFVDKMLSLINNQR